METHNISNDFLSLNTLSLGAITQVLEVKGTKQGSINVLAGYEDSTQYENDPTYLGACIGRFAGRIAGYFNLDGKTYPLYQDNGVHLHGGKEGFNKKIWTLKERKTDRITYTLESPHLDEGYPGNLHVEVRYLLDGNTLEIAFQATTDQPTVVNLTNHNYYNLNGGGTILNDYLQVNSCKFLEFNENLLPSGRLLTVDSSNDFRQQRVIGKNPYFQGLDTCFALESENVGTLYAPVTGIEMNIQTNQPSVVIYTPKNFPDKEYTSAIGYDSYPAICFENQGYTDAPNQPNFPSAILRPEEVYINKTRLTFSIH